MNILYLDCETTGLDPVTAHIVELGMLLCGPNVIPTECPFGECKDAYGDALYLPPVSIPPEASAVHGFTDADVDSRPGVAVDDHADSWIGKLLAGADILCGHNILQYDLPILRREFPVLFGGCKLPVLDTLRLARHIWPDIPSHALQVLRYRFDLPTTFGSPHGAAFDAYLCKGLVDHVLALPETEQSAWRVNNTDPLLALVDLSIQPIMVGTMRFGKHSGTKVKDLPRDYVQWLLRQPWLATEQPDLAWTLKRLFG